MWDAVEGLGKLLRNGENLAIGSDSQFWMIFREENLEPAPDWNIGIGEAEKQDRAILRPVRWESFANRVQGSFRQMSSDPQVATVHRSRFFRPHSSQDL
jgi:hypothetical protein